MFLIRWIDIKVNWLKGPLLFGADSVMGYRLCFPAAPTPWHKEADPAQSHSASVEGRQGGESRLSPSPSPTSLPDPGSTFAGNTSSPERFLVQPHSFHCCIFAGLGVGCAGSALHWLRALAKDPTAATGLLQSGYQSFINCFSRFD